MDTMLLVALFVVMVLVVIFIVVKDREVERRLNLFASIIEDINRQNHDLKKNSIQFQNFGDNKEDLEKKLESAIQTKVQPLNETIEKVKSITQDYHDKKKTQDSDVSFEQDKPLDYEKEAVNLYKQGKTEIEIAEALGLHVSEVEFILGLNDLK
ncbi:MAG: DUF6115 domain-containing protein [Campylobacteraceae bacterium]